MTTDYDVYYDGTIASIEELKTIIPEATNELNGLILPIRCQQKSGKTKDIPLGIKCLDLFALRILACKLHTFNIFQTPNYFIDVVLF